MWQKNTNLTLKVIIVQKDNTEFSNNKKNDENYIGIDTQITLNLFENLKYDLKSIRLGQSVKPVYLTKLPKDLKKIRSTNKRKKIHS